MGKGVLYQYFPNREAVVATYVEALFDDLMTRAAVAGERSLGDPPLEVARTLLRMNVGYWLENRELLRAVLVEVPA